MEETVYPLSENQRAVWLHGQLFPGSTRYRMGGICRLHAWCDESLVKRAYVRLLEQHSILSCTVERRAAEPVAIQRSWRQLHGDDPLTVVEARDWSIDRLHKFWIDRYRRDVDLSAGPLFGCVGLWLAAPMVDRLRTFSAVEPIPATAPKHEKSALLLMFDAHHIIMDFLSFQAILRDLRAHCATAAEGVVDVKRIASRSFWDFARWEQEWLSSSAAQDQLMQWQSTLLPLPQPLDFQETRGEATPCAESEEVRNEISSDRLEAVTTLAGNLRTTPFVVMLSAFQILMAHFCSRSDVIVACPVHGRPSSSWHRVIGYFANIVILRQQIEPALQIDDLIRKNRTKIRTVLKSHVAPLPWVIRNLQRDGFAAQERLAQIAFVWDSARGAQRLGKHALELVHVEQGAATHDLTLTVHVSESRWICSWRYDPRALRRELVDALADSLAGAVDAVTANVHSRIGEIRLSKPPPWAHTPLEAARNADVLRSGIDQWRSVFANKVALRDADRTMTYAQLDARTNRLRNALAPHCASRAPTALLLGRGIDSVLIAIALLKLGVPYIPINVLNPRARVAEMLEESQPGLVISTEEHSALLPPSLHCPWITAASLDAESRLFSAKVAPTERPPMETSPVYIIFTSGSTGRHKGVSVTYGNLCHLLRATEFCFTVAEQNWTLFHSLSFDFSVWEMWGPLVNGKALTVLSDQEAGSPSALHRALKRDAITHLSLTPPACELLLTHLQQADRCASLRTITLGGAVLPNALARELVELGFEVWNFYGPTEATVWSTCQKVDPSRLEVGIGYPLPGTSAYVLNGNLQWTPEDVTGDLYLAGPHIAGYRELPAETAARFVPDPSGHGARMYKTGDRVTYTRDFGLRYVGRNDRQVKVRGYRIELGDVERAIERHILIRQAVCVPSGAASLAVFYVSSTGAVVDAAELERHAMTLLPRYALPLHFIHCNAFPMSRNNKIDTARLQDSVIEHTHVFPSAGGGEAEYRAAIRRAWKDVLGVDAAADDANFYELGGTSLALTKVHEHLAGGGASGLTLLDLYTNPTVEALASRLAVLHRIGPQAASASMPTRRVPARKPIRNLNRGSEGG